MNHRFFTRILYQYFWVSTGNTQGALRPRHTPDVHAAEANTEVKIPFQAYKICTNRSLFVGKLAIKMFPSKFFA